MQLRGLGVQWTIHSQKYLLLITPTLYSSEARHWSVLNGGAWDRCWTCRRDLWRIQLRFPPLCANTSRKLGYRYYRASWLWVWTVLRSCAPAEQMLPCPTQTTHGPVRPEELPRFFSSPNKSVFEFQRLTRPSCGLLCLWTCECVSGVCLAVFCCVSTKNGADRLSMTS